MLATSDFSVNETTLAGLLHNVQLRLSAIDPKQFQQITGLFGPRSGENWDQGIPFTDQDCRLCQRYLLDHSILCARTSLSANGVTEHSLVVAPTLRGIERGLRQARKLAMRGRARLAVDFNLAEVTPDAGHLP
jgi:hypothetical protein